ncbi:MAG: DUF3098 domain-containing protein [Bacteroidetes bacterium HGW-Bacteroidetes-1]|jgi:hypothetical protein|nr:MAG: DUF3098 domain-containing protein [Bacteroidetes bacterium HGW-Bacteroidetes-1]
MATRNPSPKPQINEPVKSEQFAFARENYKWVLIGLAFIVIGFLLMAGGGSDNPDVFSDKIFSFRRWTLAPMLVLAGYVIEVYAIMKKPKH